jgi:hypothetical protein
MQQCPLLFCKIGFVVAYWVILPNLKVYVSTVFSSFGTVSFDQREKLVPSAKGKQTEGQLLRRYAAGKFGGEKKSSGQLSGALFHGHTNPYPLSVSMVFKI